MRKIILTAFCIYSLVCYSQKYINMDMGLTNINFEDTIEYKYVLIDTNQVWYITEPEKEILFIPSDRPYLGDNAIITDTNNYYSINIKSSFQYKLILGEADAYSISFEHKYDFENNKDGGIIETSHDNGETWQNILVDEKIQDNSGILTNLYGSNDTISSYSNQPGFTGLLSDITNVEIYFMANETNIGDTMLLRFTISADSVEASNEGWMLDDFEFRGITEDIISEPYNQEPLIKTYPNPVKSLLAIKSEKEEITKVEIVSLKGKKLIEKTGIDILSVDVNNLRPGIYIVLCTNKHNDYYWFSKFCKI